MIRKERISRFLALVERVQACRKCPRMARSARVLGLSCGALDADVLFVGEAPGRFGADDTQIPFHGDRSGNNFESLISQVGISRYEVFVTNAVLCNPRDAKGNNAPPSQEEIANCSPFLREQLEVIDPKFVVTLGGTALKALSGIHPHNLNLRYGVRTVNEWSGRKLIPAYHPGQRAMVHRSFANQLADYQFIAEQVRRSKSGQRVSSSKVTKRIRSEKISSVAMEVLKRKPKGITYFALHKLIYLAEVVHMERVGERLFNAYVIRQKDGPYYVDLHVSKLTAISSAIRIERQGGLLRLSLAAQMSLLPRIENSGLRSEELKSVEFVIDRHGEKSDSELKQACYLSRPMRKILRLERRHGLNLFNTPVLPYKASSP